MTGKLPVTVDDGDSLLQGPFVGRYELIRELGRGGMAQVHLARWTNGRSERLVALKQMHGKFASNPKYRDMFREEARIATKLRHQCLVDIYDVGEENGQMYLAMEYLDGISVADVIAARRSREQASDVAVLAHVFSLLAEGLHAIHEHSYVHRDVTPQNLFILRDGSVRIADFGVALDPAWPNPEESGIVKGKLAYFAPELLRGSPPTTTIDLYSLGVVLWECLTGKRLFTGKSARDVAKQILDLPIEAPSTLRPGIPPALDALVLSLLDRDWQKRPRSGRDVSERLAQIAMDLRIPATPARVGAWTLAMKAAKDDHTRPSRPRMVLPTITVDGAIPSSMAPMDAGAGPSPATTLRPAARRDRVSAIPATTPPPRAPTRLRRWLALAGVAVALSVAAGGAVALLATQSAEAAVAARE